MSAPYDRPATNPGGMECIECGVIFVGEEWHYVCAVCDKAMQDKFIADTAYRNRATSPE